MGITNTNDFLGAVEAERGTGDIKSGADMRGML